MTNDHDVLPADALADVAYLSRSDNRVVLLDALTEGPATRRELEAQTDVSRTTLDRIVNELEEREWVERTMDGEYVATPVGRHLIERFVPFLESVQALRRLGDAVTWLPEELPIGLEHFSDATVRRPAQNDPVETGDFFVDLIEDASEIRVLTHLAPPVPLSRTMHDRVVAGQLTATYVLSDETVAYLRDQPGRRERWREMLEAGAVLYRTGDSLPCNLFVIGETVLVKKSGPGPIQESYGVPIVSENETVRSWATDLIEQSQSEGSRVTAETFAEPSTPSRTESDTVSE